jgi:hypothetical protein
LALGARLFYDRSDDPEEPLRVYADPDVLVLCPQPRAQGGAPLSSHWVLDSFSRDPWADTSMLQAGEAVATETGVSRTELNEPAALRSEQYQKALADDRAFQRRYLVEAKIPRPKGR